MTSSSRVCSIFFVFLSLINFWSASFVSPFSAIVDFVVAPSSNVNNNSSVLFLLSFLRVQQISHHSKMSQTLLISKNEVIAQKLLPYWKRAVSRLVPASASTSTTGTSIFESTFKNIIQEMNMPFASHQEELDFLKNDDRDRQVMKRAYHNINHVLELCELFENEVLPALQKQESSASTTLPDHDIIFLTAFFHDVIYDAKKGDNEEKSDDMWKSFVSSLLTKDNEITSDDATTTRTIKSIQNEVSEIILATKSHLKWNPSEDLGKQAILNTLTFLDMDLAILGTNPVRYAQYSSQIKIEYQHIAPKDFCNGRLSFLEGMVGSSSSSGDDTNKSPFFTETMKTLRGEQTTKNMRWEMEELKKERERYN